MAKYAGKNAQFTIADSAGTVRDISADISSVDFDEMADTLDDTGFGSSAKGRIGGLKDGKFSVKGFFNDAASTGSDTVLSGIMGLSKAFVFGPSGSTTGMRKYTGNAILKDYKVSSPVAGVVTFQADFDGDGAVTAGTY